MKEMGSITPAEFSARLSGRGEEPFVLDVQPAEDFEDWHVPGSVNLDIAEELNEDPDAAKAALSTVPIDREVIVVCSAGEGAIRAADYLEEMAYDVKTLTCHRP